MRDDQVTRLLRLRAAPPAVSPGFVRRPHLEDRITAAVRGPVTLVSAGPGYGKTLTLASWARGGRAPGPVAWLAMDETDNHVQSFWSDVLGALAVVDIVPADSALRHMTPAAGFGARELTQIREALAELPEVLVLVLDDFQQVSNPAVLESFGQLLDHQPPQLRLVLATRSDPALRLHRLRVNGEVTDVRAHDLAFGSTEAAELFARNGLRLSEGQLTVLLDRTQGWAAGLRLALMCLDPGDIDGGISRFTGSDHLVAEYLIEEVTDQLPEQDREFLLMTSVADRLAAGLANELTGRSDGQLSLERLASRNSLVVDLAGRSEWFSVHPLLRELLLHRLSRDRPGIVADVHLRASRWFAQQGEPIPAIRHAGRALDWDEVGRLLAALGLPLVLTPSGPALVAALGPAAAHALVAPTTSTLLAAALCHYHRHDFEAMAQDARDAAALMVDVRPNDRPAAAVTIALLDVVYARTRNPAATTSRASTLLALLDQVPRWQMPVIEHYRVVATNNIALGRLWAGDLAAAETNLASVQTRCAEMGLGLVELSALAHLALLDAIHGRFPDAAGRADAGQRIAERRGWSSEPQALALYAALALTDIATNRLDAAQASIDAGLNVSNGGSDIACRLALAIAAVEVAVARHDPSAARAAAACLTSIQAHAGALPAMLARWCAVARADMHLSAGQAQAAIDLLADDNPESGGFAAALHRIALAKARLLLHQPDAALDLLANDPAALLSYRGAAVEGRIVAAVAADRTHRETAALSAIADAIDLAQGVGMTGPFVAAGTQITALIARHRHVVATHLTFTSGLTTAAAGGSATAAPANPSAEVLTERERAVLNYLPTMFKSGEIASDLFITVNTVKTHQRSIYRKLGVATRRDAVDRARDLHLL